MKLDGVRQRGLAGATEEFAMAKTMQKLQRTTKPLTPGIDTPAGSRSSRISLQTRTLTLGETPKGSDLQPLHHQAQSDFDA